MTYKFAIVAGVDILEIYSELGLDFDGAGVSRAYDAPNISMATLRNSSGTLISRSMLYTPSDTDKRYIRVYGDALLQSMLVGEGYRAGIWHGAEFNLVVCGPGYLMPHLDGSNTAGGDMSHVMLLNGKITSVPKQTGSTCCIGDKTYIKG